MLGVDLHTDRSIIEIVFCGIQKICIFKNSSLCVTNQLTGIRSSGFSSINNVLQRCIYAVESTYLFVGILSSFVITVVNIGVKLLDLLLKTKVLFKTYPKRAIGRIKIAPAMYLLTSPTNSNSFNPAILAVQTTA